MESLDWLSDIADKLEASGLPFVLSVGCDNRTVSFANTRDVDPEEALEYFVDSLVLILGLDEFDDGWEDENGGFDYDDEEGRGW